MAGEIVRSVLAGRAAARTAVDRAGQALSPRDTALLTELVYGAVRHAATLDHLLGRCARRGLGNVDEELLAHLRVGAYQLLFTRVPAAVAVSEAVEAAGRQAHLRGFVNGVLRGLERKVAARRDEGPPPDAPWTRRLPGRGVGWIVLSEPLLPDAELDPAAWLAVAASLPRAHAAALVERLGLEPALEVARGHNAPPPLFLRANLLRTTRDALLAELGEAGLAASATSLPEAVRVDGAAGAALAWVRAGAATVQDLTAQGVGRLLAPEPGERVVDLCAAPGGKATHLAELMEDRGTVEAIDIDPDRLARVRDAAARLGLTSVRASLADAEDPRPPDDPRPIDRALVDVPCSNTGVLRRRVEVRWRLAALDRPALLRLQARLLDRAAALVRPGGVVVYSTCAIDPDENEDQVAAFLARAGEFRLEDQASALPSMGGGDGGYAARLRRGP